MYINNIIFVYIVVTLVAQLKTIRAGHGQENQ